MYVRGSNANRFGYKKKYQFSVYVSQFFFWKRKSMLHLIIPNAIVGYIFNLAIEKDASLWKLIVCVCKQWNTIAHQYLIQLPFQKWIFLYSPDSTETLKEIHPCGTQINFRKFVGLKKTTIELRDLETKPSLLNCITLFNDYPWTLDEVCFRALMPKKPDAFPELSPSFFASIMQTRPLQRISKLELQMQYSKDTDYHTPYCDNLEAWPQAAFSALFDNTFNLRSLIFLKHLYLTISFVNINFKKEMLPTQLESIFIHMVMATVTKTMETNSIDLSENLGLKTIRICATKSKWKTIQLPKSLVLTKLGIEIANSENEECAVSSPIVDLNLDILVLKGRMCWNNITIKTTEFKISLVEEVKNICVIAKKVRIAANRDYTFSKTAVHTLNNLSGLEEISFGGELKFPEPHSLNDLHLASVERFTLTKFNADVLNWLRFQPSLKTIIFAPRVQWTTSEIFFNTMKEMFRGSSMLLKMQPTDRTTGIWNKKTNRW